MKKIFTLFAAMVVAAGMFAQNYGILVNGNTYFAGSKVDELKVLFSIWLTFNSSQVTSVSCAMQTTRLFGRLTSTPLP